jgi:hypothetical protein
MDASRKLLAETGWKISVLRLARFVVLPEFAFAKLSANWAVP